MTELKTPVNSVRYRAVLGEGIAVRGNVNRPIERSIRVCWGDGLQGGVIVYRVLLLLLCLTPFGPANFVSLH